MDYQTNDVVYVKFTRDASGALVPVPDSNVYNHSPGSGYIWDSQVPMASNAIDWDGLYPNMELEFDLGMDSKPFTHEGITTLPATQPPLPPASPPTDKNALLQSPFSFFDSPTASPPLSPSSSVSSSSSILEGFTSMRSGSSTASHGSLTVPTFPLSTPLHNVPPIVTATSLPTSIPSPTMFQTPSTQYNSPTEESFDAFMASIYQPIPQPISQAPECTNPATAFMQPDQFPLRALLDNVLTSPWLLMHSSEPKDEKNRSILLGFLAHEATGGTYRCLFDGCHKSLDRQDRALGHIRMHVGHRPHACNGVCGVPECQERFYCQSYLRSHVKRQKTPCDICNQLFFRRDLRKHRLSCQGIQNQALCMPHYGIASAHASSVRSMSNVAYGLPA